MQRLSIWLDLLPLWGHVKPQSLILKSLSTVRRHVSFDRPPFPSPEVSIRGLDRPWCWRACFRHVKTIATAVLVQSMLECPFLFYFSVLRLRWSWVSNSLVCVASIWTGTPPVFAFLYQMPSSNQLNTLFLKMQVLVLTLRLEAFHIGFNMA